MSAFECPESGDPRLPSCQLVADTLSDYLDGQLQAGDQQLLEQHLDACPLCLVYLEQFREVYHAAGAIDCAQLPEDFGAVMSRVIARWQADRQDAGGSE